MIQFILILAILIVLIFLLIKKEKFLSNLPTIKSLKAIGGNGGIKLTWIKPVDNVDVYYIFTNFGLENKDVNNSNWSVNVLKNNNDLIDYYIKGIPNEKNYEINIIYKSGDNFSPITNFKNIITDKDSDLNLTNLKKEDDDDDGNNNNSDPSNCEYYSSNIIYNDIRNILIKTMRIKEPSGKYFINIY